MAQMGRNDYGGLYEVPITMDFASVASVTAAEQSVTVAGVDPAIDTCIAVVPDAATLEAGVGFGGCRVSALNTVQVKLVNPTAGAVDPASKVYRFVFARK